MFVNETLQTNKSESQKKTDKMIEDKLGASNLLTKIVAWLTGTVAGPIISFFKKNGFNIALAILAFIFLFKIGEAFLGRMSVIFYKEIGFTKTDIALYSKGLGWLTTVIFTLLRWFICNSIWCDKSYVCFWNNDGLNKFTFFFTSLVREIRIIICYCSNI